MATLNAYGALTLLETAKRRDPDGSSAVIAEVLEQTNEILQDAVWKAANDTFAHKVVRRLSLPAGTWRKINKGVATEASRTVEAWETLGMLETYSEVDVELIDNEENPREARMNEALSFIEGLGQELVATMIYGNTQSTPEEFTGLGARMGSLATSDNVLDGGASGSTCTSVFVVQWAPHLVFMAYPKNAAPYAGIRHRDLGEVTVSTAVGSNKNSTAQFQAYRDHFQVKCGLVVKDPRCIGRIANIATTGSSNLFDEDDLLTLLNRMKNGGKGAFIYVNDTVKTQMEIALKDKNNVNYTARSGEGLAGEEILFFRGCPVRLVDQIIKTEAALT